MITPIVVIFIVFGCIWHRRSIIIHANTLTVCHRRYLLLPWKFYAYCLYPPRRFLIPFLEKVGNTFHTNHWRLPSLKCTWISHTGLSVDLSIDVVYSIVPSSEYRYRPIVVSDTQYLTDLIQDELSKNSEFTHIPLCDLKSSLKEKLFQRVQSKMSSHWRLHELHVNKRLVLNAWNISDEAQVKEVRNLLDKKKQDQ